MVRALRVVSVEQGLDPRDFALVAFGGAGPLHACALAEELEMETVLVPAAAGVLSALGLVAADERPRLRALVRRAARRGGRAARTSGEADLRYAGQSFELTVPLGPGLAERFHEAHEERYGYADPDRVARARGGANRGDPRRRLRSRSPVPSSRRAGPQVLELEGATAWVPEGWAGETDPHGTLVLRRTT